MNKNGENGDAMDGNTKHRVNQLTKWFFTFNNYKNEDIGEMEIVFKRICTKYVFQEETGEEEKTPHLQGSIWLKKAMRWSQFGLPKEIHWEKLRNENASADYCQKEKTRTGRVFTFGFPKPIKIISDLYDWQKEAEELLLSACEETTNRKVYWWWEAKGNKGKSAFCKYMAVKHKTTVIQGGKMADIMNIIFNTDMDNCNSIIIDIPRCHGNCVSYAAIECILNGMITNTKYETGVKIFNPPQVMIFANFPPDSGDNMSNDRWNIKELL